ncbi:MAG TPA: hypothetical protein DHW82_09465 [Spirochaetia bacterium]|nr:MAG: hypothetical protein A2Y41_05445 [Spirochaetes bacterium GWB1_36_13]HCL57218.1 hypothetical protein [Spirochaetia bacterium]
MNDVSMMNLDELEKALVYFTILKKRKEKELKEIDPEISEWIEKKELAQTESQRMTALKDIDELNGKKNVLEQEIKGFHAEIDALGEALYQFSERLLLNGSNLLERIEIMLNIRFKDMQVEKKFQEIELQEDLNKLKNKKP